MLDKRGHAVVIATKSKDSTLAGLSKAGYVKVGSWPPPNGDTNRVVLWPRMRGRRDSAKQAQVIRDALDAIYVEGAWCVFPDDVQYLTKHLRLGADLDFLWVQARSKGISVLAATQRPVWVPREMWSQSTHHFIWRANDDGDLRALGGLGAAHSRTVRSIVSELPPWHALYLNARTGDLLVLNLDKKVNNP